MDNKIIYNRQKLFRKNYEKIILFLLFFNLSFVGAQGYSLNISDDNPYQGDLLIIKLILEDNNLPNNAYLGEEKINLVRVNKNEFVSFVGINPKQQPGKYKLIINLNNNQKIEKVINIKKRNFPITQLKTTPDLEKRGFTPKQIVKNLQNENEIVNNITSKLTDKIYFQENFSYPLRKITVIGDYGNIRKNNKTEVQHLGIDLDSKIGDYVYAINSGIIVLAKKLMNYGNTIIIDHGAGIYSLYLHLNKFYVKEGQYVKKDQIIGEVGNTGYSLEPHLHLSIKVNNHSVDPLKFFPTINNHYFNLNSKKQSIIPKLQANIFNLSNNINWGYQSAYHRQIDTIIIHSSYNSLDNDYYNIDKIIEIYKKYGVSAHYLIDRDGNIYKLVDEENIAYHAGKSKMPDGRTNVNNFSIGIELIYHKNESPNNFQYESLNKLIKDIKGRYKIKYILGHKEIAPDRKDDPWNFDWHKIEK